jgi:hypothetical protein
VPSETRGSERRTCSYTHSAVGWELVEATTS